MNTSQPLVSVLIPAYNHENYVQDTIKSVINQTYNNIELIIFDDGSKDSTWQKICEMKEQCENRFANTHFETKENEGTCTTLNKLVNLAKGKYVYLLASDDMVKPTAFSTFVDYLENNPDYALVTGDCEIIDTDGNVCYWSENREIVYSPEDATYLTFGEYFSSARNIVLTSDRFGAYDLLYQYNHVPNGYFLKREVYDIIGPYTKEAPLEDLWLLRQIAKYAKMKYIPEICLSYRWHNLNTVKSKDYFKNIIQKTRDYEDFILENIDETKVFPIVLEVKKYGILYKKIGIPNILEILKYKKKNKKIKTIKFFGIWQFYIKK